MPPIRPEEHEELYNLNSDPQELRNLAGSEPDVRDRLARLLDGRLNSSRPGVHIRLSASPVEAHRFRVIVRTPGRITGVIADGFEGEDGTRLGEDGRELVINALVQGQKTEVEKLGKFVPRRYADVDEVTLRVDPPDSEVTVEVGRGYPPKPFSGTWLGNEVAPPAIRFAGEAVSLAVPAVTIEGAHNGEPPVWIYVVPEGSAVKGEIREDIDARLRALGYVE